MITSESEEDLVFDYHTIRLIIGAIALLFPWIVGIRASQITDSISWSYYTAARDLFVGFLFVIGALLISYKGHRITLDRNDVGKFWSWVSKFWNGAIGFRIFEREHEEDWVSTLGGIAAIVTALYPTALCIGKKCASDPTANIHYLGAAVLFSTVVYFCLVAFRNQVIDKIKKDEKSHGKGAIDPKDPKKLRLGFYTFCGWTIAAIMLLTVFVTYTAFVTIMNFTFWAEAAALELFGIAWLIASQFLPIFTDKADRAELFKKNT